MRPVAALILKSVGLSCALRNLSGKKSHVAPNQPISFGSSTFSKPAEISEQFIRQYVPSPKSDPLTRLVQRKLHEDHPLDFNFSPFTPALTEEAIHKSSSSTATGPDGLTLLHLKHLGPAGIGYLTDLFNLSVRDSVVPDVWKKALILPVLKPGKPAEQRASYRPIFLLCPAVKILERLLLPSLISAFPASPTQHSTSTALLPLVTQISEGFNCSKPAKRTAAVAIDISKEFNSVDTTLLLQQISSTDLHHNIVRWLSIYLRARSAACIYQGSRSKFRIVRVGLPQGFVLSPCLFNLFTSDFPVLMILLSQYLMP
jgi:hypothetical protein